MKLTEYQKQYVENSKRLGVPLDALILYHVFDGERKVRCLGGLKRGETLKSWKDNNYGFVDYVLKLA